MKVYVVFKMASYECEVDGKHYKPIRAMVGEIKDGKCIAIKLVKCVPEFNPPVEKQINIFFDENGRAVSHKTISAPVM